VINVTDPHKSENGLAESVSELRSRLASVSPQTLAAHTGCVCHPAAAGTGGELQIHYYDTPVRVPLPELVAYGPDGGTLPLPVQALLLFHLETSDGSPAAGRWVAFNELPCGRVYNQAFQSYSGDQLARRFGDRLDAFRQACEKAGGRTEPIADAAYAFQALPRLPLLATYWLGDDEFPSNAKILFDAGATDHLPIDVCAILGKMLVSRIIKAAPATPLG
jgi:hypothetical protein